MVSGVSGSVPFSYLDQLQNTPGAALPKKNAPTTPTPVVTESKTDKKLTELSKSLGISTEILSLLQNSQDTATTSKITDVSALLGDTTNAQQSASDAITKLYSNLLGENYTSAILKTAYQNTAAKENSANSATSPLDKIMADYSKALNFNNEFLKPKTSTSA